MVDWKKEKGKKKEKKKSDFYDISKSFDIFAKKLKMLLELRKLLVFAQNLFFPENARIFQKKIQIITKPLFLYLFINTNTDFFNKSLLDNKSYKTFLKKKVINNQEQLHIENQKGLFETIQIEEDLNKDKNKNKNKNI